MRKSIRRLIATTFIALVVGIMFVSLFLNNHFLSDYYIHYKQSTLIEVYGKMQRAVKNNGSSYAGMAEELSKELETGNLHFVIMSGDSEKLISSTSNALRTQEMRSQLLGYLLNINQKRGEVLKKSKNYQIYRTKDVVNEGEYIEMWGVLNDESAFLCRTPLESIRESVILSNRFWVYTTLGVVVIGSIFVWYFSKRIADPILELVTLSKRMANLDFEAKYTSGGENEIGILGENFNTMSEKLEDTISQLKTANYELQKDIEKKEQIESMRTEFIGNVSHELKTPIALIQGYAEGLKESITKDPESQSFYCDVIMDEAAKMNKMVQNLLTLNKLEAGSEKITFGRFDIVAMIRGVVQSCEILIQQKSAIVKIHQKDPIYVWADEWKVEQVIRNYLSNALNHLEGERIIDIQVTIDEKKGVAHISVFNTGKQIPEEELDQIWNKFYKVDKAHTREYGGNGIGLSIVKAIMEAFGKAYGVKNNSNGVTFWFELDIR